MHQAQMPQNIHLGNLSAAHFHKHISAASFSSYHDYVATSLARDMNVYVQHSTRIVERATREKQAGGRL